jgi:hypothetical protein
VAARPTTCEHGAVKWISRLVWVALLVTGAAHAQSESSSQDLGTEDQHGPARLEVTPAHSDIDPGPPADIVAESWLLQQRPIGSSAVPNVAFVPPLQLRLELQPMFGLTPFVATRLGPRLRGALASTEVGADVITGPLHFGTRFGLSRDDEALWLRNASFARYVDPVFDVGVESVAEYALGADTKLVQRALLGSVALHPDPNAPTVRVNTALFPGPGRSFSSVSTFGRF